MDEALIERVLERGPGSGKEALKNWAISLVLKRKMAP